MKIYKYRDFSQPDESAFVRFERIVGHRAVWCASPASLNDPEEFARKCDSSVSPDTAELLTELLVRLKGRPREDARRRVLNTINVGRLTVLVKPVIAAMIRQSRDGIGLACFGTSHDNDTLWKRYAGDGAGVCVEIELPDQLLGAQLHRVIYSDDRPIHVNHFLRARFDPRYARVVYEASLLSKTILWAPEEEIRFFVQEPAERDRNRRVGHHSSDSRTCVAPECDSANSKNGGVYSCRTTWCCSCYGPTWH